MKKLKNEIKNKIMPKSKSKKDKIKFIISREYVGTSTFSQLFEPIVEIMVKREINNEISESYDY